MTLLNVEEVEIPEEIGAFDYKKVSEDVINQSLDQEKFPFDCEISLTMTDSKGIQTINKEFRNIDAPTDVLSFPMVDYEEAGQFDFLEEADEYFNPDTGDCMLGDIVINVDRVLSQAKEYGHSVKREFAFLVAHSMMHLMGYDHMTEAEAAVMENKQNTVLEALSITRD